MSLSIRFDPHRAKRSLRISKISNLERETALMRSSSPMSICAFCRECSSRSSVRVARPHAMLQDRLVRNRDQRTDALIVACNHRGLRTAVVKQDFPSRAVSQVSPARSAATALAVSFSGGFRTPALVPVDRSALAGIRNPSQKPPIALQKKIWVKARHAAPRATRRG